MNSHHDGGELSAEARALVSIGAAGDEPSAADRARVRARLLATVAGSAATLAAAKTSAASQLGGMGAAGHAAGAAGLLGGKLGVGVLVTALAVTGGLVGMRALRNADADRSETARTAETLPAAQVAQGMPVEPQLAPPSRVTGTGPANVPAAEPAGPAPAEPPIVAAPEVEAPAAEPAAASAATPTAAPSAARSTGPRAHARRRAAERTRLPAAPTTGSAPAITSATQAAAKVEPTSGSQALAADGSATPVAARPEQALAPSLRRELALIAAAQSSLAQNQPEQALRLLDEHAASFATGSLVQERLAARAVALCALGRTGEGRRSVMDLARLAPSSPLLGRARRACGASTP